MNILMESPHLFYRWFSSVGATSWSRHGDWSCRISTINETIYFRNGIIFCRRGFRSPILHFFCRSDLLVATWFIDTYNFRMDNPLGYNRKKEMKIKNIQKNTIRHRKNNGRLQRSGQTEKPENHTKLKILKILRNYHKPSLPQGLEHFSKVTPCNEKCNFFTLLQNIPFLRILLTGIIPLCRDGTSLLVQLRNLLFCMRGFRSPILYFFCMRGFRSPILHF